MKRFAILMLAVSTLAVAWAYAGNAPKPSSMPITWELSFKRLDVVRPIRVVLPGEKQAKTFWYLRYRIINDTGDDRTFVPSFDLCTNTGQLFTAKTTVPRILFDKIKQLHNQPLLQTQTAVTGKILQGEDNAKDGVAIWPDFDHSAGSLDVFVGGLSGEKKVVKLPKPIKVEMSDGAGKTTTVTVDEIVLTKTLQLTYEVPGEAGARFNTPAKLANTQWVMR
ncbi:MAG: hypothetical protein ACYS8X_10495 [Planctomycetota bacterium]|jgi:hypothetical protein